MPEDVWQQARIIPVSGIHGAQEQERRATSALLAVMGVVKDFGRSMLKPLGAPAGAVDTFIEVPFALGEKRVRPDGLIRVRRGAKQWTALVEVKTGTQELGTDQLECYLDVARRERFEAVISISNQIPATAGSHPTKVDKRKLRHVGLHHWSWSRVLAEAVMQKEHRGVDDPEQAWILGELIRYLQYPGSGALEFDDMGGAWVSVRNAVRAGTLRPGDTEAGEVAVRFDALMRYVSLKLGSHLGAEVRPVLSRKEAVDPQVRSDQLVETLASTGRLTGTISIPDTVGPLVVTADLRAGQVICQVTLPAPKKGRSLTRVNWLLRQLKSAPGDIRVEASVVRQRGPGAAELLGALREDPRLVITDSQRELRSFTVARAQPMGSKRGAGRGSFIESVRHGVEEFYGEVLQNLRAWTPPTPKLPEGSPHSEPRTGTGDSPTARIIPNPASAGTSDGDPTGHQDRHPQTASADVWRQEDSPRAASPQIDSVDLDGSTLTN
ncbi:MAG: hypothetical protein ACRDQA_20230 [Nocardioidaceae bacterium]